MIYSLIMYFVYFMLINIAEWLIVSLDTIYNINYALNSANLNIKYSFLLEKCWVYKKIVKLEREARK